jgi:hypothetical protein
MTMVFLREQLRARLTLALLVLLPFVFVALAADVLAEFAGALGGSLLAASAASLGAGWSAAFIAGALGFSLAASAHDADHRLSAAGAGPIRVATARIGASIVLAGLAAVAALLALSIQIEVAHPFHAALAILGYGLIYIGIGAMIASFIRGELEGSLAVALIFLLDVFSGPGMTEGDGSPLSVTRTAADVLIAAATGTGSPASEWVELLAWVVSSLTIAAVAFAISARGRA